LEAADEVVVLSQEYTDRCLLERNRYMVEASGLLIANYDGRIGGGTYHTVNLARKNGLEVWDVNA
jgi:glycyl-tRNA synthetase alpha subunit